MTTLRCIPHKLALLLAPVWLGSTASVVQAQQVCATVTELGSLLHEIGGDKVTVTVFAKGTEDPHFVEPKPSFIKALSQADMFVVVGMSLEAAWLAPLLQNCRNPRVQPGGTGYLDVSTCIQPLEVPTGRVDRSMGDVHPNGNPHFLSDPLNGLKVARLICDKLRELRPNQKSYYEERYASFSEKVSQLLVGEELLKIYKQEDVPKLAVLFERGKLEAFLKSQGHESMLGGWLGVLQPYYGTKVVDDHNIWPYFARRFGLRVMAHLEPKPGVPPTTSKLAAVVELMRTEKVPIVLASAYFDPRHAQFVAGQTGAKVLSMAHQAGARPGTESYLAMVDHNVRQLAEALKEHP